MNALTFHGDRRMTVKEVAEATGVPERTIHNAIDRVLPGVKKNGFVTMLTEDQVAKVSAELKRAHNSDLASTGKVVVTDMEMIEQGAQFAAWALSKIKEQADALAVAAPKAAIADRIAVADGRRTISDVGKINGIGPRKLFSLLEERGIIYRGSDGRWRPYQSWVDAGYFELKESTYETPDGSHLAAQTYVTGAGELWLARRLFTEVS